jgi:hypothetical protein
VRDGLASTVSCSHSAVPTRADSCPPDTPRSDPPTRGFPAVELDGQIRAVHAGEAMLTPAVTRRVIEVFLSGRGLWTPMRDGGCGCTDRSRARGTAIVAQTPSRQPIRVPASPDTSTYRPAPWSQGYSAGLYGRRFPATWSPPGPRSAPTDQNGCQSNCSQGHWGDLAQARSSRVVPHEPYQGVDRCFR